MNFDLYWTQRGRDKKIVFLLTGLSCLILQACYDEDALYTCTTTLFPFQTSLSFNPNCIGDPREGMSLINNGGTYSQRNVGLTSTGKWGYANLNAEIVVQPQYDSARDFAEGLASVGLNGKSGFIDKTGKVVIPLQFSETFAFSEGLAAAKLNGKWRYIDKAGKLVFSFNYGVLGLIDPPAFTEGFVAAELNGKLGFIDKTGKVVIPFKFDAQGYGLHPSFLQGLVAVKLNGKWGYIDKSGQVIIPFKYNYTRRFDDGTIEVSIGEKGEVFDKTGKPIGK